jgi:hypothetical protein
MELEEPGSSTLPTLPTDMITHVYPPPTHKNHLNVILHLLDLKKRTFPYNNSTFIFISSDLQHFGKRRKKFPNSNNKKKIIFWLFHYNTNLYLSALMMEAAGTSKTSVHFYWLHAVTPQTGIDFAVTTWLHGIKTASWKYRISKK